jgi:hypothetical protein
MINKDTIEIINRLIGSQYEDQSRIIKGCSIEKLEAIAVEIYSNFEKKYDFSMILLRILHERCWRLNKTFEWSNENKQKLQNINDKIMMVFKKAHKEAISTANALERRIADSDDFIMDYEININLSFYLNEQFYDDESINYVLSELKCGHQVAEYSIGHSTYNNQNAYDNIYFEPINFNFGNLIDSCKDNYICYWFHSLLDSDLWSLSDIVQIEKIWADVEVIHQHECICKT